MSACFCTFQRDFRFAFSIRNRFTAIAQREVRPHIFRQSKCYLSVGYRIALCISDGAVSVVRSLLSAITGSFEAASVISAFVTFGT